MKEAAARESSPVIPDEELTAGKRSAWTDSTLLVVKTRGRSSHGMLSKNRRDFGGEANVKSRNKGGTMEYRIENHTMSKSGVTG